MSLKLYDDALIEKLKYWTQDTNITIVSPEQSARLFKVIADTNNDKPIQLPIIALKRIGGYTILHPTKTPLSFDGATLDANTEKASQLNAIPIRIPYQIDIYTRYFEEADQYARNIVFNIVNFPKVSVSIPYNNEQFIHDSNIRLEGEVEDNSDIPERLIPGEFTRFTLKIDIDDAYLWDVRYRDVYSLCVQIDASTNMQDDMKDVILK